MVQLQIRSYAIAVGRDVFGVSPMIERELFWDYTYVELAKQPNIKSQSPKTSCLWSKKPIDLWTSRR